jgi:hypothetical protein
MAALTCGGEQSVPRFGRNRALARNGSHLWLPYRPASSRWFDAEQGLDVGSVFGAGRQGCLPLQIGRSARMRSFVPGFASAFAFAQATRQFGFFQIKKCQWNFKSFGPRNSSAWERMAGLT